MKHFTNPKFWAAHEKLPAHVQKLADKNFELLKSDPAHPSLQLKKVRRYWSARVGQDYRALAVEHKGGLLWFWIGTHAEYDKFILLLLHRHRFCQRVKASPARWAKSIGFSWLRSYDGGMKIALQPSITVDQFLAWAEAQGRGRFELYGGEIVMLQAERAAHWEAKAAIWAAFRDAIKRAGLSCFAVPDGATVRIAEDTAFEPDALVYCGERVAQSSLEVPNPVIVVEVLSASSAVQDMGYKRRGYFSLPSVQHYLVADPERRIVLHYARGDAHEHMPRIVSEGSLTLEPPGP